MLNTKFGIEIEFTGITREKAARIVAEFLGSRVEGPERAYNKYTVRDSRDRKWAIMSDASIRTQRKVNGRISSAGSEYACELVSPILTYTADMELLQEIVRKLRKGGAFISEGSCGIHIHLNGADHTPQSIKNFINIIYSKNDLLYKALQITPERTRWCQKMDESLVKKVKSRRPKTMKQLEDIWYGGQSISSRSQHYNSTRYHFLNLHSFFHGNGTVELRGFNSTLHAGKVRSYVVLALALNQQALTQTKASSKKPQTENEKFAMRTYLNRIGLIGDEYKNCREHLCKHLEGSAAWRNGHVA